MDVTDFCVGTDCLKQMVKRVSWFAKIDYPLFDFLSDHDIQVTAKVLACNIDYNRTYTGRRLERFEMPDYWYNTTAEPSNYLTLDENFSLVISRGTNSKRSTRRKPKIVLTNPNL